MGKYVRKSNRKLVFTRELLESVKKRVAQGESKRSIAKSIRVNEATLRKRLKADSIPISLGRFTPVFNPDMERDLANYCKELDSSFYGLTVKSLRELVFEFAERNGVRHRFNTLKKMAGKDWVFSFCKRYNLSVRIPEKTSLARASGFNRDQVNRFFDNLKNLIQNKQIPPHRIYNMDETSILTVPNKIPKVIAPTGKKTVGKIVSAERGQLITAVCAMSATGKYVPPSLIFPRKRRKEELINGAPAGTILQVSDSGFINSELFIEWIDHFQKYEKSSPDDPILLILDNHTSHISLAAINKCRSVAINLLSLPPHSSHRLQPLDRGFFGPLKTAYGQKCEKWHVSNPGRAITQYQIGELFGKAFFRVASIEKAVNAFRSCGIWPYDPEVFTPEDFAPAIVTDRPLPPSENITESSDEDNIPLNKLVRSPLQSDSTTEPSTSRRVSITVLTPSLQADQNSQPSTSQQGLISISTPSTDQNSQPSTSQQGLITVSTPSTDQNLQPSISQQDLKTVSTPSNVQVSPAMIKPFPKAKRTEKKRKGKKSEMLTESPYKNEIEQQQHLASKAKGVKRNLTETNNKKKKKPIAQKIQCPRCNEVYEDPPDSDWIQCNICKRWYHEDCTAYAGLGAFKCDQCEGESE